MRFWRWNTVHLGLFLCIFQYMGQYVIVETYMIEIYMVEIYMIETSHLKAGVSQ